MKNLLVLLIVLFSTSTFAQGDLFKLSWLGNVALVTIDHKAGALDGETNVGGVVGEVITTVEDGLANTGLFNEERNKVKFGPSMGISLAMDSDRRVSAFTTVSVGGNYGLTSGVSLAFNSRVGATNYPLKWNPSWNYHTWWANLVTVSVYGQFDNSFPINKTNLITVMGSFGLEVNIPDSGFSIHLKQSIQLMGFKNMPRNTNAIEFGGKIPLGRR